MLAVSNGSVAATSICANGISDSIATEPVNLGSAALMLAVKTNPALFSATDAASFGNCPLTAVVNVGAVDVSDKLPVSFGSCPETTAVNTGAALLSATEPVSFGKLAAINVVIVVADKPVIEPVSFGSCELIAKVLPAETDCSAIDAVSFGSEPLTVISRFVAGGASQKPETIGSALFQGIKADGVILPVGKLRHRFFSAVAGADEATGKLPFGLLPLKLRPYI